jgi:hypothetical protein
MQVTLFLPPLLALCCVVPSERRFELDLERVHGSVVTSAGGSPLLLAKLVGRAVQAGGPRSTAPDERTG